MTETLRVEMDRRDRWHRTIVTGDGKPFAYIQFIGHNGFEPRGEVDDSLDRYADMFAAAPQMLDALQRVIAYYNEDQGYEDLEEPGIVADRAIAAATGVPVNA